MFCELEISARGPEDLDPEELSEIVRTCQQRVARGQAGQELLGPLETLVGLKRSVRKTSLERGGPILVDLLRAFTADVVGQFLTLASAAPEPQPGFAVLQRGLSLL